MRAVRLAAIDVGSNSVHMVIADVGPGGHIEVVDRVKEMVRLGRQSFMTGRLTAEAMDLAVQALAHFVRLARARKADKIRAAATSAVREARNREGFIKRLKKESGLKVQVISGGEEARLIFRAARHALGLDGGPHLLIDIGGGSVELVLVKDGRPRLLQSMPLGAARLTERFLPYDPPSSGQIEALERHLDNSIGGLLNELRSAGVIRAIGTSGTANTLVAMARAMASDELGRLHGASAKAFEISQVRKAVLAAAGADRGELPGMDAKRADLMPAAAIVMDFIMKRAAIPELLACTWALREGMLLEMARTEDGRMNAQAVRRRSVEAVAKRFSGANRHGRHVARMALKLYDATASRFKLPSGSRELLEYSAILHDIGHAIDHDRHNRHSYYLIQNADLLGFDPLEIEVMAQVARGHRKQASKVSSPELEMLPAARRRQVRTLAAILRIADAVDRSHFSVVKDLNVSHSPGRLFIEVDAGRQNADLELWATERRADLLSKLLDRKIIPRKLARNRRNGRIARS